MTVDKLSAGVARNKDRLTATIDEEAEGADRHPLRVLDDRHKSRAHRGGSRDGDREDDDERREGETPHRDPGQAGKIERIVIWNAEADDQRGEEEPAHQLFRHFRQFGQHPEQDEASNRHQTERARGRQQNRGHPDHQPERDGDDAPDENDRDGLCDAAALAQGKPGLAESVRNDMREPERERGLLRHMHRAPCRLRDAVDRSRPDPPAPPRAGTAHAGCGDLRARSQIRVNRSASPR